MAEKDPHNYRTVGYCMILVSASLVVIALLYLSIGSDVRYSDRVNMEKQFEYKQFLEEAKAKMEQTKQNLEQSGSQGKDLSVKLNEDIKMQNKP
jgi:archaellum component FlaF (FlaF/FlaG flagellin family)